MLYGNAADIETEIWLGKVYWWKAIVTGQFLQVAWIYVHQFVRKTTYDEGNTAVPI